MKRLLPSSGYTCVFLLLWSLARALKKKETGRSKSIKKGKETQAAPARHQPNQRRTPTCLAFRHRGRLCVRQVAQKF